MHFSTKITTVVLASVWAVSGALATTSWTSDQVSAPEVGQRAKALLPLLNAERMPRRRHIYRRASYSAGATALVAEQLRQQQQNSPSGSRAPSAGGSADTSPRAGAGSHASRTPFSRDPPSAPIPMQPPNFYFQNQYPPTQMYSPPGTPPISPPYRRHPQGQQSYFQQGQAPPSYYQSPQNSPPQTGCFGRFMNGLCGSSGSNPRGYKQRRSVDTKRPASLKVVRRRSLPSDA